MFQQQPSQTVVIHRSRLAGLYPASLSGHSFRRGGTCYLYSIGGTTLMVQVFGDWASQVFTRYLHLSLEDRLEAQELIAKNIII